MVERKKDKSNFDHEGATAWQHHGQARVLLYVRDDINLKVRPLTRENADLPSVSCEIGVGREKKTRVNFFYREWTSGVSGLGDNSSQVERLKRQISHWKTLEDTACWRKGHNCLKEMQTYAL